MLKCQWCGKKIRDKLGADDGYFIAWDWHVCAECFRDLEADKHVHKQERDKTDCGHSRED
jgi:hypothetical protein